MGDTDQDETSDGQTQTGSADGSQAGQGNQQSGQASGQQGGQGDAQSSQTPATQAKGVALKLTQEQIDRLLKDGTLEISDEVFTGAVKERMSQLTSRARAAEKRLSEIAGGDHKGECRVVTWLVRFSGPLRRNRPHELSSGALWDRWGRAWSGWSVWAVLGEGRGRMSRYEGARRGVRVPPAPCSCAPSRRRHGNTY